MNCFYVFHFKDYPEFVKIGFSTKIESRLDSISTWGHMLDDSIFFELPSKELALELEGCLKRIFKQHSADTRSKLPNKAGCTEFVPVEHYDYIINFVKTYIGLPKNYEAYPVKVSSLKEEEEYTEAPMKEDVLNLTLQKIGAKLKSLRLAKNLNRDRLAEMTGLGSGSVESAELGKCKLSTLITLLQVLGHSDWISSFPMDVEGALMSNPSSRRKPSMEA